jgi:tetratricopeptide (TPR) repeat protein
MLSSRRIARKAAGKRLFAAFGAAVLLAVAGLGLLVVRGQQGLANAEALADLELWSGARVELERYLRWRPGDDRARLLLAEAIIKDDLFASRDAAAIALARLQAIGDNSPVAAQARLQEGRIELLVLRRPRRAELAFRRAVELDSNLVEAQYLLWKALHLTGRPHQAEPQFWAVFARTFESNRAELLREWYMSQFFPATAHAELERTMGLLGADELPSTDTELRRYFAFAQTEPDSPLGHAAAAIWLARSGDPQAGLKVLDEGVPFLGGEPDDPLWLAARIHCLLDAGDVERASWRLERWPATDRGFDYWQCRALVLDESRAYVPAIEAYDAALAIWPGPVDWRLRFRKANCLARAGHQAQAEAERAAAKVIEELNQDQIHSRLRELLSQLDEPAALEEVAQFYQEINRSQEAEQWQALARRPVSQRGVRAEGSREGSIQSVVQHFSWGVHP